VDNVVAALRDAALIVTVILVLFLLNVRTTLTTLTALPISLAVGLIVIDRLGMTINVMTLGGFAIAIGSLVDDAIIDVENTWRRLNQNAALPADQQLPRLEVNFRASNEIRPAMVFATAIVVLVFVPLLFLGGIEGRFFRPLGITFIVTIVASLGVALMVTPALCRYLLRGAARRAAAGGGPLVRLLKRGYAPLVNRAIRWRWAVLAAAAAATALALWLGSTFGSAFLPRFSEGTFTIMLFAPPGTSLAASDRMAGAVERQLLNVTGVRSVTRRTGRAERDEHAEPVSNSEIEITVKPGCRNQDVRNEISRILKRVPGITFNVGQPIEHRVSHILSGTPAAIAISVYGEDLDVLREAAREIEAVLKPLPGACDIAANREVMIQSLPVRYRPGDLAAFGLTPGSAARQVRNAIGGVVVARVNEGIRRYDLTVRLDDDERDSLADLRNLVLRGRGGASPRATISATSSSRSASGSIRSCAAAAASSPTAGSSRPSGPPVGRLSCPAAWRLPSCSRCCTWRSDPSAWPCWCW